MQRTRRIAIAVAATVAASGLAAGSAAAAPATVTTDAGTACTMEATAKTGAGLLVKPIDFAGEIGCAVADPAAPVAFSGSLLLRGSLPLGAGDKGGRPDSADTTTVPGSGNAEMGPASTCAAGPGTDCSFSGRQTGLPGQTYTAIFGATLTAPAGESWASAGAGCEIVDAATAVCTSQSR